MSGDGIEPPTLRIDSRALDHSRTIVSQVVGFYILQYFVTSSFWIVPYVSVVGRL